MLFEKQVAINRLMQHPLRYCWPCTFFVPFLAEPLAVQWLPKHLAQRLGCKIRPLHAISSARFSS